MMNLNNLKQKGYSFFRNAALMLALAGSILAFSQDAAVLPVNNDTKVAWVTGGGGGATFGTVTPSVIAGGWIDLAKITDANTSASDYGYSTHSIAGFSTGTNITSTVALSNGQTYGTTPFTGYKVGVVANRSINGGTLPTIGAIGTNNVIVTTWLAGIQQEIYTQNWVLGITTMDASFYAHKPFDEVRVTQNGRVTNGGGTATAALGVNQVYLQRYTRDATCNAQIPLTGKALTATGTVLDLPLPLTFWVGLNNLEDEDPATSAYLGSINFTGSLITTYTVSVKDEAVVYPAGTFAGFNFTNGTGFSADALNTYSIKLYKGTNMVSEASGVGLLTAAILNTSGGTTLGVVATGEFDRIEYTSGTAISTPGAEVVQINYPVIQRFCDAPIACNTPTKLIKGAYPATANYPVHAEASSLALLSLNASIVDLDRVVDSDPNNFAVISQLVSGASALGIRVVSEEKTANFPQKGYPAGYFAGFELEDVTLISGSAANRHIVETFLDGTATGDKYDDGGSLAGAMFLTNTGRYIVGMKTTKPFNEVRITIQSIASTGIYSTRVYAAVIEKFCKSMVQPACNVITPLNRSNFPVYIDGTQTGTNGNSIGTLNHYFEDLNNITDTDGSNYAKLITVAGGSTTASVAVQDGSKGVGNPGDVSYELYPVGTFAGFDVSFPTVLGGGFFNNVTITLLGPDGGVVGTPQTVSGSLIGINSSVLSGGISRQTIGFIADVPFSGVKFSASKAVSVNWGEIRIYSAVIEKFCAPPVIKCDEIEVINAPTHPLYVNGKNTGVFSVFDGNSLIDNSQNAIDGGVGSSDTYATLQLGTTALSQLGFSVGNGFGDYPKDTYIGFDIGTIDLLQANGFTQNKIELYKDGIIVQNSTGTQLAAGVSSDLVSGGFQRFIIGTVAHEDFDEVRLLVERVAGSSVGEMRIYNVVARDFSPTSSTTCPLVLQCDGTYVLTDGDNVTTSPRIPAVIEFANTGYEGLISAGYGIDNVWNAVSADPFDFATIHFPASGITKGSISVAIPKVTLPAGTFAGFTVDKDNFPFSGGFLTNVTVSTYLDGNPIPQEQHSGGALIDFSFFGQWVGTPANIYTPGFQTTKPFDEVQISIGSAASLADQSLKVYSAYIRTVSSTTTTLPGGGTTTPIICINGACYKPAATGGTVLETKNGITALGRAGSDDNDNWPMVRKGAWTVLESKEKGFVINRVALTANLSSITNPIEGMMVYDEEADCLKIYIIKDGDTTAAWHCFNTQACPD